MIYLLLDLAPPSRGNDAFLSLALLAMVVGIIVLFLAGAGTLIFFLRRRNRKGVNQEPAVSSPQQFSSPAN